MAQAELQNRMKSINLPEEEQKTFFRRYDMFEKKAFKSLSRLNPNSKGSKSVSTMETPILSHRVTGRTANSTSQAFGQQPIGGGSVMANNSNVFGATLTSIKGMGTTSGTMARQSPVLNQTFGMTSSTFSLGDNTKTDGYANSMSPTMRKIKNAHQFQFENLSTTRNNPGSVLLEEEKLMRSSPFHRNVSEFKIKRVNSLYRSLSAHSVFERMNDCADRLRFEFRLRNEEARQLKHKIKDWKDYEKANMQKDPIVLKVREFTSRLRETMQEDAHQMQESFELCWNVGMQLDRISEKLSGRTPISLRYD